MSTQHEIDILRRENRELREKLFMLERGVFPGFYLVWSPQGASPPRVRHETEAAAVEEAERLAKERHPGEFFVLKSTFRAALSRPLLSASFDDIPF